MVIQITVFTVQLVTIHPYVENTLCLPTLLVVFMAFNETEHFVYLQSAGPSTYIFATDHIPKTICSYVAEVFLNAVNIKLYTDANKVSFCVY